MRNILSIAILILAANNVFAQSYLSKDGKLTQQLRIIELQGGFVGFTGMQFTIAEDGSWTAETIVKDKKTLKDKGKLSDKDLAKLAAILEQYDLASLPEKSGKPPSANPRIITIEYGNRKASFFGQVPPKLDLKNSANPESRFAAIRERIIGMLLPQAPPK